MYYLLLYIISFKSDKDFKSAVGIYYTTIFDFDVKICTKKVLVQRRLRIVFCLPGAMKPKCFPNFTDFATRFSLDT